MKTGKELHKMKRIRNVVKMKLNLQSLKPLTEFLESSIDWLLSTNMRIITYMILKVIFFIYLSIN